MNPISRYLDTVREGDERTKRRFIIIASTLTMLVVVALWLVYLNFTLPSLTPEGNSDSTTSTPAAAQNDSFFGIFGRGLSVFGAVLGNQIHNVKEGATNAVGELRAALSKQNETSITPKPAKFVPNSGALDPVPPTRLPE